MADLKTTYLGFALKHPFIPAASPLTENADAVRKLEDAGASAVVMHSLFEEQIEKDNLAVLHFMESGTESFAEALSYFPHMDEYHSGPDEYLEILRKTKKAVGIPVIASLNGTTVGGWTDYAKKLQEAGADAIECNVYYLPTNVKETSADVEKRYLDICKAVKAAVKIPVAMKLSAFFSALPANAKALADAGADGLVLFNRFYQPDIDLETRMVAPHLVLSTSEESRLALRWIAILHGKVKVSLAANRGIHTAADGLKLLMAGADALQVCSVLLLHGPAHLKTLVKGLNELMDRLELNSVEQIKGSLSQQNCAEPAAFERANYMKTLLSYKA
jgi:dihydroorotate dehydrogenase (fumarate)